jgi:hypothetical protein
VPEEPWEGDGNGGVTRPRSTREREAAGWLLGRALAVLARQELDVMRDRGDRLPPDGRGAIVEVEVADAVLPVLERRLRVRGETARTLIRSALEQAVKQASLPERVALPKGALAFRPVTQDSARRDGYPPPRMPLSNKTDRWQADRQMASSNGRLWKECDRPHRPGRLGRWRRRVRLC